MKCPECGEQLCGIPPLSSEEWICDNIDCSSYGTEFYGATQKEVNKMKKEEF